MTAAQGTTAARGMTLTRVSPGNPPPAWSVRVPGSKSLTNRALLLAGLAGAGLSRLRAPLIADDTQVMARAVASLGATVELTPERDWVVGGIGGPPRGEASLWCGMAGTAARFLLPVLAAGEGRFFVDADPQLRRRPLGPLLDALESQGAQLDGGALPLTLVARGLRGGSVQVDASVSSQFVSGLLMAAPLARAPLSIGFTELVSGPYVRLTLDVMRAFGVDVEVGEGTLRITPQSYASAIYPVEPDASTASYFLASAALTGTEVTLPGIDLAATHQGDIELVDHLVAMGCTVLQKCPLALRGASSLRGMRAQMGDSSDVFMTLACLAPFAGSPTIIEGIGHARGKESDRIAATSENLRRLGIRVQEGADTLTVYPGQPQPSVRVPTYEDHRIAMAFALIGARVPVELEQPEVVAKTCPGFFELWRATGARVAIG